MRWSAGTTVNDSGHLSWCKRKRLLHLLLLTLQELVRVVGTGAAQALDAQCTQLQAEISQQNDTLAQKQSSVAILEEQHARALQRKEAMIRNLQKKLQDAGQQLREHEATLHQQADRYSKLRTVYTDNQKLKARVAKLTEEAEAREEELKELRELVDLEGDRAAASMAAHEETR